MNEALIKELIKYKLNAAGTIIDHLPAEMSEEIRNVGKTILEGLNESSRKMIEETSREKKTSNKLNSVPVE